MPDLIWTSLLFALCGLGLGACLYLLEWACPTRKRTTGRIENSLTPAEKSPTLSGR